MISTINHLAKNGIDTKVARSFILANLGTPELILAISKQFEITNQMLADIVGNVSASNIIAFFKHENLDSEVLDSVKQTITIATNTVDTFLIPDINLQVVRNSFTPGFDNKFVTANAYGDFNGDGHMDIFMAASIFLSHEVTPFEILVNDGNNNFTLDDTLIQNPQNGTTHSRKAVVADFNGDGKDDVIVADHGFDALPFPGGPLVLLLSTENGLVRSNELNDLVGFNHSVAVGDIDRDGDEDAFFTRDQSGESIFIINDGKGNMSFQNGLVPDETFNKPYYTSELIDVDKDGKLDLMMAGHEMEDIVADTVIYWGRDEIGYSSNLKTVIPKALMDTK